MHVSEKNNQLIVLGQPAFFNYLILGLLFLLIPTTAWGMWTSGEVSIWFVVLFVVVFGAAAPFILNDIIKPSLSKAYFDPVQKTVQLIMSGVLKSQTHEFRFRDIEKIEHTRVENKANSSVSRQIQEAKIKFKNGQEFTLLKGHRADLLTTNFEVLATFMEHWHKSITINRNSISRKEFLRANR